MVAIGVSFGATNIVVAAQKEGKIQIVPSSFGHDATPCVVAFDSSGIPFVGEDALNHPEVSEQYFVTNFKQFLGRQYSELGTAVQAVPYKLIEGPDGLAAVEIGGLPCNLVQVTAMLMRAVKSNAQQFLNQSNIPCSIAAPALHYEPERVDMMRAARYLSWMDLLRVYGDAAAAGFAYQLERRNDELILVFDLGGTTLQVSVLEAGDGALDIKSTVCERVGASDFDRLAAAHFAQCTAGGVEALAGQDWLSRRRLLRGCEEAKIQLSKYDQTTIVVKSEDGLAKNAIKADLTRAQFEHLSQDLLQRCGKVIEQALGEAGITSADISEVVLAGGGSHIPSVKTEVERVTGRAPLFNINPSHVIATGAAIKAVGFSNWTAARRVFGDY